MSNCRDNLSEVR